MGRREREHAVLKLKQTIKRQSKPQVLGGGRVSERCLKQDQPSSSETLAQEINRWWLSSPEESQCTGLPRSYNASGYPESRNPNLLGVV